MGNKNTPKNKPHVVVVDDVNSNLDFIADVLQAEEIDIKVAVNGKEALEVIRKHLPDLILLDIAMPELDGYEVCKELKKDTLTRDIPVIFLTAKILQEDIVKGFEVGAVDYIVKPFNIKELISRVKTHLELRRKTHELLELNQTLEKKVEDRTKELSKSNKELINTNIKLSEANEQLSKLDKAKDEFIRHINHELRTPLQGLHGYILLLDEIDDICQIEDYTNSLKIIADRLIKLAELSLIFTELQTKSYNPVLSNLKVNDCLNNVISFREAEDKDIKINVDNIDDSLVIKADEKLLKSCLTIIVDNAIKYSPDNGTINIKTYIEDSYYIFEIIDNGPGFSAKAREKLFELFTADNLNYKSYGFGIGLATAKSILNVLSGNIEIDNNPDKGATVKVKIPVIIND